MQRLPAGFLEQVIEYRSYERAKRLLDAALLAGAEAVKSLPEWELIDVAKDITLELGEEDRGGG